MWDEANYYEPAKIVYINKKRILRKAIERAKKDAVKKLKKKWKEREKNENIRLLQVSFQNLRNTRKRKGN